MKTKKQIVKSISDPNRLEDLLQEVDSELGKIQPKIEKLEKEMEKLKELKLTKQKLITLKLSIKSIVDNFSHSKNSELMAALGVETSPTVLLQKLHSPSYQTSEPAFELDRLFLPDQAFEAANQVLRQKNSLNYEIFRAIVFNGGRATTEQIKQYLVQNNITQPTTGEGFEHVELTDISSRVNYLVRKGIVDPAGKGLFISRLGWQEESAS